MKRLIWMAIIPAILLGCSKKVEKDNTPAAASVPVAVEEMPAADDAMSAMLRGHPHARQICFDPKSNGFFLDYGPPLEPKAEDDGYLHGWFLIQNVEFHKASNNTWFIATQDENKYVLVYPDVTGLTCKQQQP